MTARRALCASLLRAAPAGSSLLSKALLLFFPLSCSCGLGRWAGATGARRQA